MSLINKVIPAQNFELIRDKIATILTVEMTYQANQFSPPDADLKPVIYTNRIIAFNESELPAVNITFAGGSYDNKDMTAADGSYIFNIDVYTAAKSTDSNRGDELAAQKRDRIMGVIRAILENPVYDVLDFARPSLSGVKVDSMFIPDPAKFPAMENYIVGRVVFNVKVAEDVVLQDGTPFAIGATRVKISNTNKGYLWGIANAEEGSGYFIDEETPIIYFIAE